MDAPAVQQRSAAVSDAMAHWVWTEPQPSILKAAYGNGVTGGRGGAEAAEADSIGPTDSMGHLLQVISVPVAQKQTRTTRL